MTNLSHCVCHLLNLNLLNLLKFRIDTLNNYIIANNKYYLRIRIIMIQKNENTRIYI